MTDDDRNAWWQALLDKVKARAKIQCLVTGFIEDTLESNGHVFRVRIDIEGMDPSMDLPSKTVAFGEIRAFWHAFRPLLTDAHVASRTVETLATEILVYMSTAPWESPTSDKKVHAVDLRRDDGVGARVRRLRPTGMFGGFF